MFAHVVCAGAECEMVLKKDVVDKHLHELIKVCHKYEVTHVFPTLSTLVKSVLTIENCCDYIGCTVDFCPNDIKCTSYLLDYIELNFRRVVHTDGFRCLAHTHPDLVVLLVQWNTSELEACKIGK